MRRRSFLHTTVVAAAVAATLATATGAARPRSPAGPVVLVDWDGVDPRYLDAHLADRMPHLHRLAREGVRSVAACTYKAVSNPNRAGIATGARPHVHGNAAYVLDPDTGRAVGQTRTVTAETLAQGLRRQGLLVLASGWYIVHDKGVAYRDPGGLYTQGATWEENVDAVVRALSGEPVPSDGALVELPRVPDLIAVYSADIDAIGHAEGPGSPRIPDRLAKHDAGLGRIVDAAERAGLLAGTTFVFVSDHGMTGYTASLEPRVFGAVRDAGFRLERLASGRAPDPASEVVVTASPRAANLYLRGAAATPEGRDRVGRVLRGLPELEAVHDRAALDAMGAAAAEGDFAVDAAPPYAFVPPEDLGDRERGGHASLREAHAPLILSGAGVARGAVPHRPRTIDVAPTVARLLGAEPPADAEGRALDEVLVLP
jgi:arylsulfatase A-like enzyme